LTLASYSPGGINMSLKTGLKPRNESQLVKIRPKGKLFQHEVQPLRNDVCLTLFYSEVQLIVIRLQLHLIAF